VKEKFECELMEATNKEPWVLEVFC
ncbi:MAG: hypothetical protein RLZZ389_632, partial [Actinomycetota bacterium]